jgi:hypothetical protein
MTPGCSHARVKKMIVFIFLCYIYVRSMYWELGFPCPHISLPGHSDAVTQRVSSAMSADPFGSLLCWAV